MGRSRRRAAETAWRLNRAAQQLGIASSALSAGWALCRRFRGPPSWLLMKADTLTRWRGLEGTPKGGRERTVPLSDDARVTLAAHRHLRGPYVFCHGDGSPFTDWDVREVVPQACKVSTSTRSRCRRSSDTPT